MISLFSVSLKTKSVNQLPNFSVQEKKITQTPSIMTKLSVYALLLFLACLSVFSQATPIEDIAETIIDITETLTSAKKESFAVEVNRIDDLVNDNGDLLAERLESVIIEFELNDDQLLVNNVPVELGVTSITVVEAKIISTNSTAAAANNTKIEDLEDSFDIGLVTVEVTSSAESLPTEDSNVSLRRITIKTRIVEIDGVDIIQSDAVEKILEVKTLNVLDDDAENLDFIPKLESTNGDEQEAPVMYSDRHRPCALGLVAGRLRHWWRCSSRFTRVIIASIFLTSIFGLVFIAIPTATHALIVAARRRRGTYQQVALADEEDNCLKGEQVIYIADEEKHALMEKEKH
ncbi:hypothetical protein G9A89_023394 [Geosiphon pyriformis]|nr:hypothetical protein G9A89_023394 [Geosiphon pyriformis]